MHECEHDAKQDNMYIVDRGREREREKERESERDSKPTGTMVIHKHLLSIQAYKHTESLTHTQTRTNLTLLDYQLIKQIFK